MELKNAKINFLGDSITEGVGTSGVGYRYCDLIARKYGLAEMRNYGISGTRFAKNTAKTDPPSFDLDFCMRAKEMDPDADAVVVFGATNDFGHGDAPIGQPTDRTNDTFWGACHVLMTELIEMYPGKPIVFLTPLHRLSESNPCGDCKPAPVGTLEEYIRILKTVAEFYSLPVCDLWSAGLLQPKVPIIQERFVPDGLHPNDAGHVILAERVGKFLETL